MGNNTLPLTAVRFALKMKPDAVFLLSDGEFQDSTDTYLRAANLIHEDDGRVHPKIVVHTICFRSLAGAGMLKLIAAENGGTFRFVK